ncbi:FG-GAP-like repeat-containing protein [Streptomyces sp. NPDC021224]|uniref:FG-GAP-like repeat-containing protein n=1 Tax=unclassified Streptomyces TaxID=2593676 RepID=UPI0037B49903
MAAGTTGFLSSTPGWQPYGCNVANDVTWTRYDGGPGAALKVSGGSFCGTSAVGDSVYVQQQLADGAYRRTEMSSGTSVTYRMPAGYQDLGLAGDRVVAGELSADGLIYTRLHLLTPDGTAGIAADVPVTGWPAGAVLPTSYAAAVEASDGQRGAVFFRMPDGTARLGVVDLSTGVLRGTDAPVQLGGQVQIDGQHVIWLTDRTIVHVLSTPDLSVPERQLTLEAVSSNGYAVALDGDAVLAAGYRQDDAAPDPVGPVLEAYPLDGGEPQGVARDGGGQDMRVAPTFAPVPGGGTLVVGGGSAANWWVQRVVPDGAGGYAGEHVVQVPATPATLESVSVAGGVVVAAYDNTNFLSKAGGFYRSYASTSSLGLMSNGLGTYPCGNYRDCLTQQVWATDTAGVAYTNGGMTVAQWPGGTARIAPAVDVGGVKGAFGQWVLRTSSPGQSPQSEVDSLPGTDEPPGNTVQLTQAAAPAALWGHLLYATGTEPGVVTVTDVRAKAPAGTVDVGAGCTPDRLQAVGHWLWRRCAGTSATVPVGVVDLSDGRLIALPAGSAGGQTMLGDGFVVNQDAAGSLHLTDFHSGTAVGTDLGIHPRQDGVSEQRSPWTVDQYGGGLVYRADDDTLHVTPLGVPTSPLSAPDSSVSGSYDRNGASYWRPVWWLSKPAASWQLTVSDSFGRAVRTFSGGPTDGAKIAVTWNGTTDLTGVSVPPGAYTWKLTAQPADGQGPAVTLGGSVAVSGGPDGPYTVFYGRDSTGCLRAFTGTGSVDGYPFQAPRVVGYGWGQYTAMASLAGQTTADTGDLVARDASGVLWYYEGTGNVTAPFKARTKVGTGWNAYGQLVGAGDLTGDGRPDLVARDASGALWLYRGTGSSTAPFAARTRIGAGWDAYGQLVGTGDLTGDGRSDLVARDASGVLWLYRGTGSSTAPFAARTRIGAGWNAYDLLLRAGNWDGDHPDLIARDPAGHLWFYSGTGIASQPFAPRVEMKQTAGWDAYNPLL